MITAPSTGPRSALPAALLAASLVVAPAARASDVKLECVEAHERGQVSRNAGGLLAARSRFTECARDACPTLVRQECAQWLVEVEASLPSVVIEAHDAQGHDALDVRLLVDGAVVRERLDGMPVSLDPGQHTLRLEMPGASPPSSVEQSLMLRAGEKQRRIAIEFRAPAPPAPPLATAPAPAAASARSTPALAWVLAGVAGAGAVSFAYFAIAGKALERNRASGCAPACTDAQVAPVRADYLLADLSLGAGAVAGALATWLFLHRSSASSSAASSRVWVAAGPAKDGAALAVEGQF